jgi:hypothetical protein
MAKSTGPTIIPATDVVKARRGRKAVFDGNLLEMLRDIDPSLLTENAVVFDGDEFTVDMSSADPAAAKAKVAQHIRKHWERAYGRAASISWTPDGVPQVMHKA